MKLTASKRSANLWQNRSTICSTAIGSISLLSGACGCCPAVSAGVLYEADAYTQTINTISTTTGEVKPFVTGLPTNGPIGLAFDKKGYLYASIYASSLINKISPDGKTVTVFASGLGGPYAQAFDPDGNLFVANADAKTISKISPDGQDVRTFVKTGLYRPAAIAFDRSGTMYVSDRNESIPNSSTISKVSSTGDIIPFITGLGGAYGMIFDKNDNLFVADTYGGSTIKKFAPGSTAFTVVTSANVDGIFGLALDESGNLFGSNYINNTIDRISSTGFAPLVTQGLNRSFGLIYGSEPVSSTAVPEPFTTIGTLIGGTAALRVRKKLQARTATNSHR